MKRINPGLAKDRYRMRRVTDDEMAGLIRLARDGCTGPGRAIDALWALILHDAHGISLEEAAERRFHVQDYAMAADQAEAMKTACAGPREHPVRERPHEADVITLGAGREGESVGRQRAIPGGR